MVLLKANLDTNFQINWARWTEEGIKPTGVMQEYLCSACREELETYPDPEEIVDGVDMLTGEVHPVSVIQEHLITCCSQRMDYLAPTIPLNQAVFRALLATWDNRMTPVELQKRIGRSDAQAIFRLLTKGPGRESIVPVLL